MRSLLMEEIMAEKNTLKKKTSVDLLREKKIMELQDKITASEAAIRGMETQSTALIESNITGITVVHKQFGTGTVIEQDAAMITVEFSFGTKRFMMPSAFVDGFLETTDANVSELISKYQEKNCEIKRRKEDIVAAMHSIKILEGKK